MSVGLLGSVGGVVSSVSTSAMGESPGGFATAGLLLLLVGLFWAGFPGACCC